ncbi:MAG: fibrillarin-like rRNA/tRNA 2'-O-methyltransferase, partial [Candidatus Micrarchaeaceae archaeon]
MNLKEPFPGVYLIDNKLATINLVKGKKVYGEDLVSEGGKEYRLWNPYRSKLSAAILNGIKTVKVENGASVL